MTKAEHRKRYYGLMSTFIALAAVSITGTLISYDGRPTPTGSFGLVIFTWGAISAYQGKITTAKWIAGLMLVWQIVSLVAQIFVSQDILNLSSPGISKEAAVVSSLLACSVLTLVFLYARSLETTEQTYQTFSETSSQSENPFSDNSRYKKHTERESTIAQAGGAQSSPSGKSYTETYYGNDVKKLAKKHGSDSPTDDPWQAAIEYFPDLGRIYNQISRIDPARADAFKSDRMKAKDFSRADDAYWSFVNDISVEIGGKTNTEMREFVKNAINKGDYVVVRRLLELSITLGAENMNSHVLDKFKKSMNYD